MSDNKLHVVTVVGTRPEIIRLSRVISRLNESTAIKHTLIHTGQNYDYNLNEVFIDYTKIKKIRTHNGIMVDSNGNVLAGYYDEDSVIWVKISHPTAVNFGIYDQILMAIIAHEIGHSQGFEHVGDEDADNLMYEGNGPVYDNLILKKKTLTEILLSPYKKQ